MRTSGRGPCGVAATAPSAPQSLQATAGNAQVSLSWTAPASDGGSLISGYKVYRGTAPNPSVALTRSRRGDELIDTGPQRAHLYYKVAALNASASARLERGECDADRPGHAPSAPQSLQATAGNGQVTLTWSAPCLRRWLCASPGTRSTARPALGKRRRLRDRLARGARATSTPGLQERHHRLLQGGGPRTLLGVSLAFERGECDADRSGYGPQRPSEPAGHSRQRPGHAHLESAPASDGGSALTGYKVYRSTSSGKRRRLRSPRPRGRHELHRHGPPERTPPSTTRWWPRTLSVSASLSNEASATPIAPATAPSAPQNLLATSRQRPGHARPGAHLPPTVALRSPGTRSTARPALGNRGAALRSPPSPAGTSYIDTGPPERAPPSTTRWWPRTLSVSASLSNEASATPIAPATAPSAPQNLLATAGNGQVTLDLERTLPPTVALRSPGTACTAEPRPTRPSPSSPISAW